MIREELSTACPPVDSAACFDRSVPPIPGSPDHPDRVRLAAGRLAAGGQDQQENGLSSNNFFC